MAAIIIPARQTATTHSMWSPPPDPTLESRATSLLVPPGHMAILRANFPMTYSDYFMFFGVVSIVLGVLGYVRAKSVASLYAGGLSGILLAASAVMAARRALKPDLFNWGYLICLLLSVALLGRFLPAFLKSKKIYPAGIMAVLGVLGVIAGILALMKSGPLLP